MSNSGLLHRHSPLARKVALWTVLFSSALTLILSSWQLYRDYHADLQTIDANLDQIQHVHLESIAASVWSTNQELLLLELEGIQRLRDMHYASVKEGDLIWAEVGKLTSSNIVQREFPIIRRHRDEQRQIGTLTVVATLDGVYHRLLDHAMVILISNGLKTFLVAGFMLFLFQRLVTRHVQQLAHQVSTAPPSEQIQLSRQAPAENQTDELDNLVHALNQMRQRIHTTLLDLSAEQTRVRTLFNHANDAIFVIDPATGKILDANQVGCDRYGYTHEEFLKLTVHNLTDASEKNYSDTLLRRIVDRGAAVFERQHITRDGKTIPVEISSRTATFDQHLVIISLARDITERKAAEIAALQLNADLERRVIERTTQLQATNKELESFCYAVSHDLRAPLRAIDGFSRALTEEIEDRLNTDERKYLERIRVASHRMGQLIDDLLRLSRLTRTELLYKPVNLTTLAEEVITPLRAQDPHRTVDIDISTGLLAHGDEGLLRTALENLLGNAWKYTGKRAHAQIIFGKEQKAGETVYFIKDNGAGFDMRYAGKLFGTFQRLHDAQEFQGNGIGLATTQRIIARHGGRIWADAQPNQGANFYFTLNTASMILASETNTPAPAMAESSVLIPSRE